MHACVVRVTSASARPDVALPLVLCFCCMLVSASELIHGVDRPIIDGVVGRIGKKPQFLCQRSGLWRKVGTCRTAAAAAAEHDGKAGNGAAAGGGNTSAAGRRD